MTLSSDSLKDFRRPLPNGMECFTPGEKIYAWIIARLDESRTVYVTTYLRCTKITPQHRNAIRYRNGHCEMARGKHWDSINFCRITAS